MTWTPILISDYQENSNQRKINGFRSENVYVIKSLKGNRDGNNNLTKDLQTPRQQTGQLHRKTPAFLPTNRKRKQRLLADSGEAASRCILFCVLLLNKIQGFPQLEHNGKFVFAGVAAEAVADRFGNDAVMILKFNGISPGAPDDGIAFCAIQAEVLYAVFQIVGMPTFRNGAVNAHFLQIVQRK